MPEVHRNGDSRACGASTIALVTTCLQITNPPNRWNPTPGGGSSNAANPNVYIGGTLVVIKGNGASPDLHVLIPLRSPLDPPS